MWSNHPIENGEQNSTIDLITYINKSVYKSSTPKKEMVKQLLSRDLSFNEAFCIFQHLGIHHSRLYFNSKRKGSHDIDEIVIYNNFRKYFPIENIINDDSFKKCDNLLIVYSMLYNIDKLPAHFENIPPYLFPSLCYNANCTPLVEKVLSGVTFTVNDVEYNPHLMSPASIAIKKQDISLFKSLVNHGLDINRYVMIPNSDLIINEIISTNNITFLNYILSLKPILSKFTKVSPLEHAFSCSFGFNLILNSIPNIKEEQQSYPKIIQTFISLNRKTNELLDKIFNQSSNCNYKPKTKLPLPGPHSAPRTNDKIKSFFNLPKNRFNEDALHLFNPHATIII